MSLRINQLIIPLSVALLQVCVSGSSLLIFLNHNHNYVQLTLEEK